MCTHNRVNSRIKSIEFCVVVCSMKYSSCIDYCVVVLCKESLGNDSSHLEAIQKHVNNSEELIMGNKLFKVILVLNFDA